MVSVTEIGSKFVYALAIIVARIDWAEMQLNAFYYEEDDKLTIKQ